LLRAAWQPAVWRVPVAWPPERCGRPEASPQVPVGLRGPQGPAWVQAESPSARCARQPAASLVLRARDVPHVVLHVALHDVPALQQEGSAQRVPRPVQGAWGVGPERLPEEPAALAEQLREAAV
jgi:hypothetical protein